MNDQEFFENDELLKSILADNAMPQEEAYEQIVAKPLMTGHDLLNLPYQSNDYLVENLLWKNDIVMVIAEEKAGKTIFSSQMCYAMTCGQPFLGSFDVARPFKILYVQAEGSLHNTQTNLKLAISQGGVPWNADNWRHLFVPALSLDTDAGYNDLKSRIDEADFIPDVILVDPLYMAMDGDLSDNKAARKFCRHVRQLMDHFHCSFIVMHHQHRSKRDQWGKKIDEGDDSIMGSFVWKAFATHVLHIANDKTTKIRTMTCNTQRNGNVVDKITMKLNEKPLIFEVEGKEQVTNKTKHRVMKSIETNEQSCVKEIANQTGFNKQTVRNNFTGLKADGFIEYHSMDGHNKLYELTKKGRKALHDYNK